MKKEVSAISCLLLEDERSTGEMMLDVMAKAFPDIIVYPCFNLEEADRVVQQQPDMMILDINLPDGNSFEWLNSCYSNGLISTKIIFVTAYSDFAVQAFKFNAIDFLLKPFSPSELIVSIDKVIAQMDDEAHRWQMELLLQNMLPHRDGSKKIVLKTVDDIHVVRLNDVFQATSDSNYTRFHLIGGTELLVSQPLKSFEKRLEGSGFMRVHQSHLVNMEHIATFKKKTATLVMSNQVSIPVSQSKKQDVIAYLSKLS